MDVEPVFLYLQFVWVCLLYPIKKKIEHLIKKKKEATGLMW